MAGESVDDYLKAIFELSSPEQARATGNAIAQRLAISAPSVTAMLQKLARQKPPLVSYRKHHGAVLTAAGTRRALGVIRRHRLIELFLHDILGYSWDEVHEEAEKLEHAISKRFEDSIDLRLGHPAFDPHGHPIPAGNGDVADVPTESLADLVPGTKANVYCVWDRNPVALRYLHQAGLVPGARVEIVEKGPVEGPIILRVAGNRTRRALSLALAREIRVASISKGKIPHGRRA